jgi:hypothetical protein
MYALAGARGKDAQEFFLIGHEATVRGASSGPKELLAFANDWPGKYKYNHGCLELTITRVP